MVTRARDPGPFVREIEHTADLGFEVEAPSLPLLFERAGLGMLGLMIDLAVEEVSERTLRAWGAGERVDRARHHFYTEVKGVTYHQLALRETAGGWWARIILDV